MRKKSVSATMSRPLVKDRSLLIGVIAMSFLATLIIVLTPFVDGMSVVERVASQLVMSVALMTTGFTLGVMVVDDRS